MVLTNNSWFTNNIFYICFSIVLCFIIFVLVCLIVKWYLDKEKYKKYIREQKFDANSKYDQIIDSLGGLDNIESVDINKNIIVIRLLKLKEVELSTLLNCTQENKNKSIRLSKTIESYEFGYYLECLLIKNEEE